MRRCGDHSISSSSKVGLRGRVAGAALGGLIAVGLAPAAPARADLLDFDWLTDLLGSAIANSASAVVPSDTLWADVTGWLDPSTNADAAGAAAATAASAAATDTATPVNVTVPLMMNNTTEPVVDVSVGGGTDVPVLVDSGSNGLIIPWYDMGLNNLLTLPTGAGVGSFSGGMDYFYVTLPKTIDFGDGAETGATDVDAVLFAWPTNLANLFNPSYYSIPGFLGSETNADGILGIGSDAVGPNATGTSVLSTLPGDLNQGVLINESAGTLTFGPSTLTGGTTVDGVANTTLAVSLNGGATQPADGAIIDSGGVFGTIPSSMVPGSQAGYVLVPGTSISVYNQDGDPLYTYTVGTTPSGLDNSPIITSSSIMNTGYEPFSQMPVYISLADPSAPTTTFYNSAG